MKLLDEGTDVWRPVDAKRLSENIFQVIGSPENSEVFEFSTGSQVRVETRDLLSGTEIVAVALAD